MPKAPKQTNTYSGKSGRTEQTSPLSGVGKKKTERDERLAKRNQAKKDGLYKPVADAKRTLGDAMGAHKVAGAEEQAVIYGERIVPALKVYAAALVAWVEAADPANAIEVLKKLVDFSLRESDVHLMHPTGDEYADEGTAVLTAFTAAIERGVLLPVDGSDRAQVTAVVAHASTYRLMNMNPLETHTIGHFLAYVELLDALHTYLHERCAVERDNRMHILRDVAHKQLVQQLDAA